MTVVWTESSQIVDNRQNDQSDNSQIMDGDEADYNATSYKTRYMTQVLRVISHNCALKNYEQYNIHEPD